MCVCLALSSDMESKAKKSPFVAEPLFPSRKFWATAIQHLTQLGFDLRRASNRDDVFSLAANRLFDWVGPDVLLVMTCMADSLHLEYVLPLGMRAVFRSVDHHIAGECLCGLAYSERRFVSSMDIRMDARCVREPCRYAGMRSFAAVPVLVDDTVVAVLGFGTKHRRDYDRDREYVEALAGQVGIGLSNVDLRQKLEDALETTQAQLSQQESLREKLTTEAEFNRVLIDHAAEGICVSHATASPPYVTFTVWNRRMVELTGYSREEINELGWFDTLFPDPTYRAAAIARTEEIREGRDMESEDWTIRHRDGSARVLSLSSCNFDDIEVRHTLAVLDDRTAERKAQQESEKLHDELQGMMRISALGEAASSLLHELNQPLAAVSTNTASLRAILQRGGDDRKMVQNLVDEIDVDTQRASALVARLRQYLRKGPVVDAREPCDLHDVIRDVLRILSGAMKRQGIQVTIDLTSSPSIVMGDKMELEQVVMNLVMNAMDALQEVSDTGQIRIHTKVDASDCIICSVLDHGHGFPPEMLARAFEPFATTKDAGLGLGLPICKRVIEGHGGRIWIAESDLLVTNIVFCLPLWSST